MPLKMQMMEFVGSYKLEKDENFDNLHESHGYLEIDPKELQLFSPFRFQVHHT